ncbi:MAG: hypothetical protein JWQ38_3626 [Flavipsychrobacter sp.]|nr:hypothetical protein [Flavipsychrobacter sp.]
MENYKAFYIDNAIASCAPTKVQMPEGHVGHIFIQYDESGKSVVYALIRAASYSDALIEAMEILKNDKK